jgi:hypothetical protein
MSETCVCSEYLKTPIVKSGDAPMGNDRDAILSSCDLLAKSPDMYSAVYRCRVCGTVWAEACYDSGMVLYEYLYPAPPVEDPVRWLLEEAKELPKSQR